MQKLFAAIDAEPVRKPSGTSNISARLSGFFASLSPRTLALSAAVAAVLLLLQAGVIGAMLATQQLGSYQTASFSPPRESAQPNPLPRAFVRFAPEARFSDIAAFLD